MSSRYYSEPVVINYEPQGWDGRGTVRIDLPNGAQWRMTLEDAENLGEALVQIVRQAEETSPVQGRAPPHANPT